MLEKDDASRGFDNYVTGTNAAPGECFVLHSAGFPRLHDSQLPIRRVLVVLLFTWNFWTPVLGYAFCPTSIAFYHNLWFLFSTRFLLSFSSN